MNALLWRRLDGFEGGRYEPAEAELPAGPVLEVLFLATAERFRESGHALALVMDLEAGAREAGFVAICVAAVPRQGVRFWARADLHTAVDLKAKTARDSGDEDDPLVEPSDALGAFLKKRMLLFSDTPLRAKALLQDGGAAQKPTAAERLPTWVEEKEPDGSASDSDSDA